MLRQQLASAIAERDEARAQQAALAEVLRAINAATGDFSAVFHLILARATSLCDAPCGGLVSIANDHAVALANLGMPQALVDFWSTPQYVDPNTGMAKVLRLGKTLHQADMAASEMYRSRVPMTVAGVELGGIRSFIMVPLRNERGVIGLFALYRPEVRPFSDRQIALVEAFAAQAAMAMENARLLTEQREALAQQTATAEVLGVINSSPGNLAPVFDAVLDKARKLCDAAFGDLWTYDGECLHLAATQGEAAFAAWLRAQGPVPVWPGAPTERLLQGADHVQYEDPVRDGDFAAVPEFSAQVERAGVRSILFVPMKKDSVLVGVVIVYRREVRRFNDRQIAVLQGFAAQAVIAMENARLITEQREALEQQTATAEVLEVINASPGNLDPVFGAMLEKAMRLCEAAFGIFGRFDGKLFEPVVDRGVPPELIATTRQIQSPPPNSGLGRLAAGESVVQLVDLANTDVYRAGFVGARALVDIGGAKTAIFVALRKDGVLRGVLVMYRREVRAFSDKQVALLQNFAAQAVIAMENARLLTEQREALEQQTATADILRVISQSPTDVQPVLEAVVKAAVRFCGAEDAIIALRDGDHWEGVAHEGPLGAPIQRALPLNRDAAPGRSILDAETIEYPDIESLDPVEHAFEQYAARRMGFKAVVSAPMLRDQMAIGAVALRRTTPGSFTARQIELLESFAAQAVIAIENVRLFTELRESLDQQTATADILRVISQSPTDVQPVLDVVVQAAQRFCGATDVVISLREGDELRIAAHAGPMGVPTARRKLDRSSSQGRAIVDARVVHTADFSQLDPVEWSKARELSREFGFNSAVAAPMLRDGTAIGTIFLRRPETGPFAPRQIALLEAFAAQAVIAIENVRLFTELRESLDQQTATADILRVISQSPTDVQPVLDVVVKSAQRFCGADDVVISLREDDELAIAAHDGPIEAPPPRRKLNRGSAQGRAVLDARTIHLPDIAELDPAEWSAVIALSRQSAARASVAAPMLREGVAVGAIMLRRRAAGAFTERQIALLEAFAAQAVIAIENVRLFTELRESLDQQTATADILRVISQSPTDVAPVLDAVAKAALRFCTAEDVVITLREGEHWLIAGHEGPMPASIGTLHPLNRQTSPSWAILDARTVHLPDITALDPVEYAAAHDFSRRQGFKAAVAAPMLREGQAIGAIALRRAAAGVFTQRQIELLQNFAAQAVIALENTRLFTELRQRTDDLTESLDYQTATSELLEVISRSSSDIQPVFDTMLASAARLCGVAKGDVAIQDGDVFRHVAFIGCDPEELAWLKERVTVPGRGTSTARALLERRIDHVLDQSLDPERIAPKAATRPRTTLAVPLLRDGKPLGVISLLRDHVEPFSERQIALIETFADQAVIAMENARLLTELRQRTDDLAESLDYQTATSEVLGVISRSPTSLQPVLEAMTAAAVRLCGVRTGGLSVRRGDSLQFVALVGQTPEFERWQMSAPIPVARGIPLGDAILDKAPVQIVDVMETEAYKAGAEVERAVADLGGHRTLLHVPLLREDEAIGVLTVSRGEPQAFTERQIGLIKTFADQAVIAMENARLLSELRQRTDDLTESLEYQTATSEVLEVISRSTTDIQPVLDKLVSLGLRLAEADHCGIVLRSDDGRFRFRALAGPATEVVKATGFLDREILPDHDTIAGRALLEQRVVHVEDVHALPGYSVPEVMEYVRTTLSVPLMRDGEAVGVINLTRSRVELFTDRQVALIKTFADQAVIAMENARLLSELTQRTDDLTESLEYQTATSELLEVVSRSAADVQPVLDTMLASAARLCEAGISGVVVKQGDEFWYQALLGGTAELFPALRAQPISPARGTIAGHTLLTRDVVHVSDIHAYPDYSIPEVLKEVRTALGVPLMREGELLGAIVLTRGRVEPFSERQIALVKTFADQAVIAMENARLLSELTRREEELRVTFDHMGDGVVMFDAELKLASWNRNFQELLDIPDTFLATRPGLEDYVRLLVQRGELGHDNPDEEIERYRDKASTAWSAERMRPDGRILEVRNNPVPGGGAVLIYSDITVRKKAEEEIRAARDAAEATLDKLKAAQANLVQSEKMASLGQLTAGIAHEIKNPLNFVNNFATLSVDLLDELKEVAGPALATLDEDKRAELDETMELLTGNLGKIAEHGKRADGIVKSMLSHSRGGTGDWAPSDINALVEEALNLAYHGARAQDKEFNVTLERDLEKTGKPIEVVPQDVTRVFLNLFGNGFYAANKRRLAARQTGFKPTLTVTTRDLGDRVEVRVRDNGTGIPPDVREKLFQPFFTTKPTGEGTGLGLSISYDIVTQQHGGTIEVESEPGVFTEFTVRLPRARRTAEARGA